MEDLTYEWWTSDHTRLVADVLGRKVTAKLRSEIDAAMQCGAPADSDVAVAVAEVAAEHAPTS